MAAKNKKIEKVVRDGKVAVLYSPGYGAGWYTWANSKNRLEMLFDPGMVALVERAEKEPTENILPKMERYASKKWPDEYLGGLDNLSIEWVPEGMLFRIRQYDGAEHVEYLDVDSQYIRA